MRKVALIVFILSACAWKGENAPRAPISAPAATEAIVAPVPEATSTVVAPATEEKWDSKTLAEFPMGCQYKGYELCNPILEWDDLAEEDKDTSLVSGDRNVYFPQKRLYFPMDEWQWNRGTDTNTYKPEYYLGEWEGTGADTGASLTVAQNAEPHGVLIKGKNVKIGRNKVVSPETSDYENPHIKRRSPDWPAESLSTGLERDRR